uniref:Uncharacterized protein n=2 Tax=Viruses TaxID=10239 RepID=A0A8S5PJ87_9CAUD|nr:MAG TPA: hypothetical protein [Myoviridae sp. ct0jJ30]DAE31792.1 MAG TPA: hypothetical protein [virus sp. ctBM815]DAH83049.1 MAG TPA: hypothetical protein [Bacteriophage sp.]DAV23997.1 MAG TPA: hypothetical protein [Bacteriophage sp.]
MRSYFSYCYTTNLSLKSLLCSLSSVRLSFNSFLSI